MKRLAVLMSVVVASLGLALSAPSTAKAHVGDGSWIWNGNFGNYYMKSCYWYSVGEACSGWNYWPAMYVNRWESRSSCLAGFESTSHIRGVLADLTGTYWVHTSDVSMGGYLRGMDLFYKGTDPIYFYDSHAGTIT